jgi:deoxyribodipyrimidine photo-lyase
VVNLETAVVLFTRDLRVHDNPALAAAHRESGRVVHLFVRDPSFPASPRRLAFLERLLAEIPELHVVHGDQVEEVARFAPDVVHCAEDASPYARRRERRLAERFDLRLHPGVTIVPFDELKTYRVFSPYFRVWSEVPRRALEAPPFAARRPLLEGAQLSPYLHFGALSPLECAVERPELVRKLAWRDFYAQLLRAEPHRFAIGGAQPGGELFDAWRERRTGYAVVDAGLRQLELEGWVPNRVRMVVASFLVHDLGVDWRLGARRFEELLLDADVASNRGNWLWIVANTRRVFNPLRQEEALAGYVREWADPEERHPRIIPEEALAVRRNRS